MYTVEATENVGLRASSFYTSRLADGDRCGGTDSAMTNAFPAAQRSNSYKDRAKW
jgi:hypothetical protein